MRRLIFTFSLTWVASLAFAGEPALPNVERSYTTVKSGDYVGQRLKGIVPPHAVRRIAVTRMATSLAPTFDHDDVINGLFASEQVSVEWCLLATETVRVEYTILTGEALFILSICGELRHEPMTAAILRGNGFACRFKLTAKAEQLAERIVVDSSDQSAFALGTHPNGNRDFQRRIAEYRGRGIREIINLDQIRKNVRPKPFVSKIGVKVVDLSDDLIVSALLTGRIVDRSDVQISNHLALQVVADSVVVLQS